MSTLKRCHNCGWAEANDPASRAEKTGPQIATRDGVAYWRGVQTCGSIWCCPICSAKIRNARSIEISEFTAEWINRGNEVYMVTFTSPHDLGMALAALMLLIAGAFRALISGRAWAGSPEKFVPAKPSKRGGMLPARVIPAKLGIRDRLGIAGTIRALEVTHGLNGWHPHLHVLVFVRDQLDAAGRCAFELYFRDQWRKFITSKKYRPPSDQHGVKVERCYSGAGAAEYVVKLQESGRDPGNEMARADMKTGRQGHRVPFEILEAAGTGEKAEVELWHEYEKATFRHQAITWSPALRTLAKEWLNAEEKTDEELAAEEVNGEVVVDVSAGALQVISCTPGLRAAFLDACEDGGLAAIEVLAAGHGFRVSPALGNRPPKLFRTRRLVVSSACAVSR